MTCVRVSLFVVALCSCFLAAASSRAATITLWTFETSQPQADDVASLSGILSEVGSGSASGVHASALSDWSSPVGNGSPHSLNSNNWAVGDYYQFQTSTVGFADITFSFDASSSNTGPRDFKIQYSTDGVLFQDAGITYAVLANASPNPVWSSLTYRPQYFVSADLSSISALNQQPNAYIRLVLTSTTSANGNTIAGGGTSRIDNVMFSGTEIPEPATLVLCGIAVVGLIAARRNLIA